MDSAVWSELQIPPTRDVREIRRAYSARLRQVHPEDDAEGFKRLRSAYERAMLLASIAEVVTSNPGNTIEQCSPSPPVVSSEMPRSELSLQERAYDVVHEVLDLSARGGELAAANELIRVLHSDELQNIEMKTHVEEMLVDRLVHEKALPFVFLNEIADEFKWERDRLFVNDFSNKRFLLDRLEGWRAFRKLVDAASSPRLASVTRMQAKAASMLISKYDPRRFFVNRILCVGLVEAVQNRIELLQTYTPHVQQHLDQRTVEWWRKRKVRGSSLTVLIVIIAVMVAFVVNNFAELPMSVIALLGAAVLLFSYAVWQKWPTARALSSPKELESYLVPLFRVLVLPVILVLLFVASAFSVKTYFVVIAGMLIINGIVRSRKRS